MFTINKKFGIGKVENIENGIVTVYFDETDETKKLVEKYVTIYNTEEEAEEALNPSLSEDDMIKINEKSEEDEKIMKDGAEARVWIEEHNIEVSKKLMRNI